MPPVIAAIISYAVQQLVTNIILRIIIGMIVSMILNAIFAKPKPKGNASVPYSNYARDRTLSVRQPISPHRVIYGQVKVGGTMVFMHTTNDNKHLHIIQVLAAHEVQEIGDIYLNDELLGTIDGTGNVTTGKYANVIRVKKYLGSSTQTADPDLTTEASGVWTADHRLRGRAYLYLRLIGNADVFPNGLPNFSALVKGKNTVYDPRSSPPAYGYTNNAALCIADYLMSDYGLEADYATEIGEDDLIIAANICDESVSLVGGGTELRYALNGSFDTSERPDETISELLTAMDGKAIYASGQWILKAGAYEVPTVTLDEEDAHGNIKVSTRIPRRELFNAIKGVYVSPLNQWQPSDFPVVTNTTYETQDNGERIWRDINLPYTTSASTAQRIGRALLERGRQQIVVNFPAKLVGLRFRAGDTLSLTVTRLGWSAKAFECVGWQFELYDDAEGEKAIGVNLTLRETASTIWDWNATTDETTVDAAPDTNLPNPFVVAAVSGLSLQSGDNELLLLSEGSVISRILVSWDADEDVYVDHYEIEFKKTSGADWTVVPDSRRSPVYVQPVEDGTAYDVRIRLINRLGVRGAWTSAMEHVVVGKTAPPTRPDTFTVSRLADGTRRYTWTHAVVAADVRSGGGYLLRYYVGTTSVWGDMLALHSGLLSSAPFESNALAAGTYTWAIKTIDSSGNESTEALFAYGTIGDPRLKNVLLQRVEEDLLWPGTRVDCFLYSNKLIPTDVGDMDDLPATINDLAVDILHLVQNANPITYTTTEIDLGTNVSFTPLATVSGSGNATITMQVGTTVDGGAVGAFVSLEQVTGKRYLKIKVVMTATDSPPASVISGLTLLIDAETVTDEYEDVNTATESATWFDDTSSGLGVGHFRIASKSGNMSVISSAKIVALQNVGAGWTWDLVSKSAYIGSNLAAEFRIYNNAGALANAVVDIELKGPKI